MRSKAPKMIRKLVNQSKNAKKLAQQAHKKFPHYQPKFADRAILVLNAHVGNQILFSPTINLHSWITHI